MPNKVKLTQNERMALITKAVEACAQNNLPQFEFLIIVSAIIDQEEVDLTDLGWGTEELAHIRTPAADKPCFSCRPGESLPVEYHAPKFGYNLCRMHADLALVAGWEIFPIYAERTPSCDECGKVAETVVWDIRQKATDGVAVKYEQFGEPHFGCTDHPVESRKYNSNGDLE
jgi:hypothetical protein